MKSIWKWIIGIVLGLIVLAALVGGALMLRGYFPMHARPELGLPGWHMRGEGFPGNMMRGYKMHGYGMMGYGPGIPFGGFLGWLFPLGFLALLVLGIVWLVRSLNRPRPMAVETHACANCGKPIQADWRNCPHCGKKQ
jgi:hypothetical protein